MERWRVRCQWAACVLVSLTAVALLSNRSLQAQAPGPFYLDNAHPISPLSSTEAASAVGPSAINATCVDPPPGVTIAPGDSPAGGYLALSLFGVAPVGGVGDDTITNFSVPAYRYSGYTWTSLGFSSNGYLVAGPSDSLDSSFINQSFPSTVRPNNVLAPFWTDLNPSAAGALRISTLTDGSDTWIVLDWEAVREFSQAKLNSFEIWIGINSDAHPGEDITFAYGTLQGNGDLGFLTVGAENLYGNRGQNRYLNGTGVLPTNGTQLRVTSSPWQCLFLPRISK